MRILESFLLLFYCALINAKDQENVFTEELVIKELSNNFVNSYFQFTTRWNIKSTDDRKFIENDSIQTDLISLISFQSFTLTCYHAPYQNCFFIMTLLSSMCHLRMVCGDMKLGGSR